MKEYDLLVPLYYNEILIVECEPGASMLSNTTGGSERRPEHGGDTQTDRAERLFHELIILALLLLIVWIVWDQTGDVFWTMAGLVILQAAVLLNVVWEGALERHVRLLEGGWAALIGGIYLFVYGRQLWRGQVTVSEALPPFVIAAALLCAGLFRLARPAIWKTPPATRRPAAHLKE